MINLSKVSCCLNTKDATYPAEILALVQQFPFAEILIRTHSNSPHRKYEMFEKASSEYIYYQDDDAICPIKLLAELYDPAYPITLAMKPGHFDAHAGNRATMGLGWGAIFPKALLGSLKKYTDVYGEDEVYKRETERILTYLNYPQNRLILPIYDLPSASDGTRLWQQPQHNEYRQIAEARCRGLSTD